MSRASAVLQACQRNDKGTATNRDKLILKQWHKRLNRWCRLNNSTRKRRALSEIRLRNDARKTIAMLEHEGFFDDMSESDGDWVRDVVRD